MKRSIFTTGIAVTAALAWTACSGSRVTPMAPSAGVPAVSRALVGRAFGPDRQAKAKLKVTPKALSLLGTGASNALTATVTESGYGGEFKQKSTCKGVAAAKPATGKGPKQIVTVTATKAGACAITFSDSAKRQAVLKVGVTTMALQLKAPIPAAGQSATLVLVSVNGKRPAKGIKSTVTVPLKKCTGGCTVAGPQSPPGKDAYTATIANAKGVVLANANPLAATVKANAANAAAMTFTAIGAIVYTCTSGCPTPAPPSPEIELYSTTPSAAGYSGAFTATQSGWTTKGNALTYAFKAVAGKANICPGSGSASFTVSPASGVAGTSFTATASSGAVAGACAMTLTGGAGQTLQVKIGFTTSGIGINGKHGRN